MVAIKDMDMPSCCMNCGLLGKEEMYCSVYPRRDIGMVTVATSKPDWCPLVEIEERPVGHWIPAHFGDMCSNCRKQIDGINEYLHYKYCPYCGAEMRGAENDRLEICTS